MQLTWLGCRAPPGAREGHSWTCLPSAHGIEGWDGQSAAITATTMTPCNDTGHMPLFECVLGLHLRAGHAVGTAHLAGNWSSTKQNWNTPKPCMRHRPALHYVACCKPFWLFDLMQAPAMSAAALPLLCLSIFSLVCSNMSSTGLVNQADKVQCWSSDISDFLAKTAAHKHAWIGHVGLSRSSCD